MMELLNKRDITLYNTVEVIAFCSNAKVKVNLSTTNSYREEFTLNGVSGAYIKGIIFKNGSPKEGEIDSYADIPVMVKGTVNEYRGEMQLVIETITTLGNTVDTTDVLNNMVDTTQLSRLNDLIVRSGSFLNLDEKALYPAKGLEKCGAGTLVERLITLLEAINLMFPDRIDEYTEIMYSIMKHYQEGTNMNSILDTLKHRDTPMLRALLMNDTASEDYKDFVVIHHTIMKPRGVIIEVYGDGNNVSGNRGTGIHND